MGLTRGETQFRRRYLPLDPCVTAAAAAHLSYLPRHQVEQRVRVYLVAAGIGDPAPTWRIGSVGEIEAEEVRLGKRDESQLLGLLDAFRGLAGDSAFRDQLAQADVEVLLGLRPELSRGEMHVDPDRGDGFAL